MRRADIKIGFNCNNMCRFCVQGQKRHEYGDKTVEQVKRDLDDAIKDCEGVVFTGGEPTLNPNLLEYVRHAKRVGFKSIQIQSNGRMFAYQKYSRRLIEAGVTEFSPALHGHTAELHDYLTGVAGSFNQTVMGIKFLKNMGMPVIVNSVITKSNYRHLPDMARLLVSLGADQFQFAFVHALGSAGKNFYSIVPRKSLVAPYIKEGLDIGIAAGVGVMTEAMTYCFLDGYEDYIAENYIPPGPIYDWENTVKDFYVARTTTGKLKGPDCQKCKWYDKCEGPWKEYPEHYGWKEFVPVTE